MRDEDRDVHQRTAKTPDRRHVWGPRPVGQVLPNVTRAAFRRRSPAAAQIMADWREIVGPAVAEVTAPRRLSGTTLVLACAGPVAMEVQHLAVELAARINGHLGRVAVERFRFVQEAVTAAPPPERRPPPRPPGPLLPLPGIAPGALYDALQALANAVRRA